LYPENVDAGAEAAAEPLPLLECLHQHRHPPAAIEWSKVRALGSGWYLSNGRESERGLPLLECLHQHRHPPAGVGACFEVWGLRLEGLGLGVRG